MDRTLPFELENPEGQKNGLVMDLGKPEEAEEVFEFLVQHFFPIPPLRQLYFITEESPEEVRRPAFEFENVKRSLSQPFSMIVRYRNQIIAVMLVEMTLKESVQQKTSTSSSDKSVGWLVRALLSELNCGVDLFARYNTERIAHITLCAVRSDYASCGLAPDMGAMVAKLAWQNGGAGAVKAEAFTTSSTKACMIGYFETVRSIDLLDFEVEGRKPLADAVAQLGDNRIARLMVLPLIPAIPYNSKL